VTKAPLRAAIEKAPPTVAEASTVFRDFTDNEQALTTLLRSTDRVTGAVDRADPGVGPLHTGAARTFPAVAAQSRDLQQTIDLAVPTLKRVRGTLGHANRSLNSAGTLVRRIGPGVEQLRLLAKPLSDVLTTVVHVGPDATSTLHSVRRATPELNPLLRTATRLSPVVDSIGKQAVHELECIRPYTPDIVSIFSNWGDFFSFTDNDKMARVIVDNIVAAPTNLEGKSTAEAVKAFPGLRYAFPRPPGLAAGQPWFLPQCGAGPDALDPTKDPEAK
jgi:ABC-type transporter Mla subunit MlaD